MVYFFFTVLFLSYDLNFTYNEIYINALLLLIFFPELILCWYFMLYLYCYCLCNCL